MLSVSYLLYIQSNNMVKILFLVLVLSVIAQIQCAPFFISTGNPSIDGAIAGAGLGFFAGQYRKELIDVLINQIYRWGTKLISE